MATPTQARESRRFTMHPDLLFSVIKSQAGTLSKAVLELAMNSVDAGATKVEILLDRRKVSVSDDGNGFAKRSEIENFFETFGTPHAEGDATYGRFRMGRGQIMAFTKNRWVSGEFLMDVDVQGRGLDYILETGLPLRKGCHVEGDLYEPLDPSELLETERTLKEQCRYVPIPVTLNGKNLSEDAKTQKWTMENDDARIRVADSRQLSVYNLGVLVAHFQASEFGVGGVVVSKLQLDLNFARNDILRNKCAVWKRIRPVLAKLSADKDGKAPTQKRDEAWRVFQAKTLLSRVSADHADARAISGHPLFTDISGKHLSIEQLARLAHSMAVTVAPEKSLVADKLHQSKIACVLAEGPLMERFGMPLPEILAKFRSIAQEGASHRGWTPFGHLADAVGRSLADFADLAKSIESDHYPLDAKDIPKEVSACLRAIDDSKWWIGHALREAGLNVTPRKIKAMRSETADAYTDGKDNVFINIRLLRGVKGPNVGIAWAARMASLLIHEHCHDFNSGTGHQHDAEFHEAFHDAAASDAFGDLVSKLVSSWASRAKGDLGKVGIKLLTQMDRQARMEDRLELRTA